MEPIYLGTSPKPKCKRFHNKQFSIHFLQF